MKHFLLFYDFVDDYLEKRPQFRSVHLKDAWDAKARGELVMAGTLTDPVNSAVLFFQGEDKSVAENFAKADPYVTNGLVTSWRVREWNTVVGDDASNPVQP
ncbi:MAG: YciI-like protein [Rhodospirillaceae bacterium]